MAIAELDNDDGAQSSPECGSHRSSSSHGRNSPHNQQCWQQQGAPPPDTFSTIRRHCERHLRRLERYKKARSFCSLADADSSGGKCSASQQTNVPSDNATSKPEAEIPPHHSHAIDNNQKQMDGARLAEKQFEELREKMLSLVENDIVLLAKLLSLGDTLRDLRQRQAQQCVPSADAKSSGAMETDFGDADHEEDEDDDEAEGSELRDECRPLQVPGRQRRQRQPIPPELLKSTASSNGEREVTRLYVRDGVEDDDEEDEDDILRPNVQYFSRKNSVLRIPIPPRASNRAFGRTKQQSSRGPTTSRFITGSTSKTVPKENPTKPDKSTVNKKPSSTTPDELDSGHSSASEQHSPAPATSSSVNLNPPQSRCSTLSSGLSTQGSLSGASTVTAGSRKERTNGRVAKA